MNEIRFKKPEVVQENEMRVEPKKSPASKIILTIIIIVALAFGSWYFYQSRKIASDPNGSDYYAVFLSDGQIYFGRIIGNNKSEMVISNAYYLQSNGQTYQSLNQNQATSTATSLSMIKLSDELHGPTDSMTIKADQIMFYEQLQKTSKVVELIMKTE